MSGAGERGRGAWWRWSGAPVEPGAGPPPDGELAPRAAASLGRRDALKLMAAASALSTASCLPPEQETVPYVDMPEGLVPGRPRHYATALPLLGGPAAPSVVESHEGRPTKVEGNERHPEHVFGSDAFAQASVLGLYDPERARACYRAGQIQPWDLFHAELAERRERWAGDGGRGLRLLTGSVTSPSLSAQIAELLVQFPEARWHSWEAVPSDNALLGARLAFGRLLEVRPRLERARVMLCLDADPLGPGPQQVPFAADFAAARRARAGSDRFLRLYAVEPAFTLTGAAADHRLPLPHGRLAAFAAALAARLGGPPAAAPLDADAARFLEALAADLEAAGPAALILVGEGQPPELHALAHWINGRLGSLGRSVELIEPLDRAPPLKRESLAALATDMAEGAVDGLVILGGNPVFDAPADLGFAAALEKVPFSLRFGCWRDETSIACRWHLAAHHAFEAWGDARSRDGTVSLVQPLIRPLFDTRSEQELLAALAGDFHASGHDLLRRHWHRVRAAGQGGAPEDDFEAWWRRCLHDGWIAGTGVAPVAVAPPAEPPRVAAGSGEAEAEALTLLFRPDPSVWDGRFAENAWLQELPRPFSKLTWGNALHLAPAEAARRGLEDGDLVDLVAGETAVTLPVLRQPGLAEGTALVHLGYGRRRAGPVGSGVGVDVYPLRKSNALWAREAVRPVPREGTARLATTQQHHGMHGRDIVREIGFEALAAQDLETQPEEPPTSLYPEWPRPEVPHVPAWSMVVDQSACIGCNACVAACQAENNVPVVGPEEIERGRTMHWLRVDSYHKGPEDTPETLFQPVPCMHCEKAPCEPVCPVEASVHDAEGLNAQVYNRCVGTRFCQSNCPYQVRRFNFYGYAREQEYAHLGEPLFNGVHNPNVTLRARGVMEKCTYCVQRIKAAEHDAIVEDRPLVGLEVVTACQQACPTQAIHFGDLAAPDSEVAALRRQPHEYGLLEHLGTRPRTRYLARVRRRNPALEDPSGEGEGA